MNMNTALFASFTMAALLNGYSLAYAALTPTETVNDAITGVFHILRGPSAEQRGISKDYRVPLEKVLLSNLSYEDMARRSMGTAWVGLNEPEQQHFNSLFLHVLRDAIACRLNEYSQTQVVYLSEQVEGNYAQVLTLLIGDKVNTGIDVHLVNRSGRWLMYDAVIDGVHLVDNYRAQFLQILRDGSYAGLVERMEVKTLARKNFER
jgi:phospholipid transport system substrate-binding protein